MRNSFFALLLLGLSTFWMACTAGTQRASQVPLPFGPDFHQQALGPVDTTWQLWIDKGDTLAAADAFAKQSDDKTLSPQERSLALFGHAETLRHRARFAQAVEAHVALLTQHPESPLALWSALQIWELREHSTRWLDQVDVLQQALQGRELVPELRAWLGRIDLEYSYRKHRQGQDPSAFRGADQGFSQTWSAVGPFSIYPYHDLDTVYPPEKDRALAASYPVDGFDYQTREVFFDEPFGDPPFAQTGVHYLETWLTVDKPTEVVAHLTSTSNLKVWLDDALLFSRDLRRGYPASKMGTPLTLQTGTHRVRVRMSVERSDEKFTLLFTPKLGEKATFTYSASAPAGAKLGTVTLPKNLKPASATFPPALRREEAQGRSFLLWLLALYADQKDDIATARWAMAQLEDLSPTFPAGPFARGNILRGAESYPEAGAPRRFVAVGRARKPIDRRQTTLVGRFRWRGDTS